MKRFEKVATELKKTEVDFAILVSPSNVIYTSGFEIPYWPYFMGDMSMGLPMVTACINVLEPELKLLASDYYKTRLERSGVSNARYYVSFSHLYKNDVLSNYEKALKSVMNDMMKQRKKAIIGVEKVFFPQYILQMIEKQFPNVIFVDITDNLNRARCIKTADEISIIKKAAKAADAAQDKLYEISRYEGEYTELDVWFEVQKAASDKAGVLTPFVGELVTGPRTGTSDYPLGPTARKIKRGDIAIMDICPRVSGYWGDCSNVVVFWDKPGKEQMEYFKVVRDVYEVGKELVRPGIVCRELNQKMEEVYKMHGYEMCSYQGHQIGANVNESPKITYCEDTVLEENMVLCIEPQLYTGRRGKTGVRLEKMLHVTANGAKELNHFKWGIEL